MQETLENYLQKRLNEIGLSEADIKLRGRTSATDNMPGEYDLLTEDENKNIVINYPTLSGDLFLYTKNGKTKPYYRLRYSPQNLKENKYHTPPGAKVHVFFPPQIIKTYQRKTEIKTLFVVEGEFKALAGTKNGLHIVGISGIHNFLQKGEKKEEKFFNKELEELIRVCKVKNLVLLFDGDCLNVTYENEDKDLYKRLNSFYTAVRNFREYTKHLDIDVYFSHLKPELNFKGLDDLYFGCPDKSKQITKDIELLQQSKDFFVCQNVTDKGLNKLRGYFNISSETEFYEAHKDLLDNKPFTFCGTKYQSNGVKLEILIIPEAKNYLRIGDDYFEKVKMPDKDGKLNFAILKRKKGTILDDHKKKAGNILEMIKKYKGACNVPKNFDFKEEIDGFYNLYQPNPNVPAEGEIESSLKFVEHIFGEQKEIGLDYLQLLYLRPTEILPILCLVSKEQETGKTTFAEWLRYLFGNNVTSITNQDLEGQFNDNYATKLVIYVDETFIDKKQTKERIKNLSTSSTITINAKQQQKQVVDFFGKFILCSNNEKDFINIDNHDIRFWVRKIESIKEKNPHFKGLLYDEAPAFLYFLKNRKMHIPSKKTRMWFEYKDLKTDALNSIVDESKSAAYKEIKEIVRNYFLNNASFEEVKLLNSDIMEHLKSNGITYLTSHKLGSILKEDFNVVPEKVPKIYDTISYNGDQNGISISNKGRYYTLKRPDFLNEQEIEELTINK